MASSLNCPNCGGAAEPNAVSCGYCGSRLAEIACSECLGSMLLGAKFCPHCGAKVANPNDTEGKVLGCPGCNGEMRSVRVGATPMHQCDGCGSAWLLPEVFTALCIDQREQGAVAAIIGPPSGTRMRPPTKVRYLRCPICEKTLNRVNFGRTSGIVIDVCKSHGVWFERDELREILGFIARGGLEQLRSKVGSDELLQQLSLGGHVDLAQTILRRDGAQQLTARFGVISDERDRSPFDALFRALFT
jgi:Zn-finger nucleic acid-binding protein